MIISQNINAELADFQKLMADTTAFLNADAKKREEYYCTRKGQLLEKDVFAAISACAKGTPFDNRIELVSGASFPDIVAKKFYGVEVKSTQQNHWSSIGSSILESTRIPDVERIYLTFGKLSKPIEFISKPYEERMADIAVTHYPRYKIDMNLKSGETIFDKMGVSYEALRKMNNPVEPVSNYYRSKLKKGESLWWASDNIEEASNGAPPTVRLWSALTAEEKERYRAMGFAFFPEVLKSSSHDKYSRYALWLATQEGVIKSNIRDEFSAGGQVSIEISPHVKITMPAAFGRVRKNSEKIKQLISEADETTLARFWNVETVHAERIRQWCEIAANEAQDFVGYEKAHKVLSKIFNL